MKGNSLSQSCCLRSILEEWNLVSTYLIMMQHTLFESLWLSESIVQYYVVPVTPIPWVLDFVSIT